MNFNNNFFNEITYRDALRLSINDIMSNNKNVFMMGVDVGLYGGAYGVTKGLIEKFGKKIIIYTPI